MKQITSSKQNLITQLTLIFRSLDARTKTTPDYVQQQLSLAERKVFQLFEFADIQYSEKKLAVERLFKIYALQGKLEEATALLNQYKLSPQDATLLKLKFLSTFLLKEVVQGDGAACMTLFHEYEILLLKKRVHSPHKTAVLFFIASMGNIQKYIKDEAPVQLDETANLLTTAILDLKRNQTQSKASPVILCASLLHLSWVKLTQDKLAASAQLLSTCQGKMQIIEKMAINSYKLPHLDIRTIEKTYPIIFMNPVYLLSLAKKLTFELSLKDESLLSAPQPEHDPSSVKMEAPRVERINAFITCLFRPTDKEEAEPPAAKPEKK